MPDDAKLKPEPTPEEMAKEEFATWLDDYEAEYRRSLFSEYGMDADAGDDLA